MRRRLPDPLHPRPPRDSDYERILHVPVLWGSLIERCKRELLRLFSDGPVTEREFHHAILRQGWAEGEVVAARTALGVREGSTLFLPYRGRVRMLALPGQTIAEKARSNSAPPRRSPEAKPRQTAFRLGARRVS